MYNPGRGVLPYMAIRVCAPYMDGFLKERNMYKWAFVHKKICIDGSNILKLHYMLKLPSDSLITKYLHDIPKY